MKSAAKFYEDKVKELNDNLKELEAVVQQKQVNVRTIEEGKSGFNFVCCVISANIGSLATQDDGCSTTSWSAGCSGINGIESKVIQIVFSRYISPNPLTQATPPSPCPRRTAPA